MSSQQNIDRFTLAYHRVAVERLRRDPSLLVQARATLDRWQAQRGPSASDVYMAHWRRLLDRGVDAVEHWTCAETAEAATLRNASPLGFVLTAAERMELHRKAAVAHAA